MAEDAFVETDGVQIAVLVSLKGTVVDNSNKRISAWAEAHHEFVSREGFRVTLTAHTPATIHEFESTGMIVNFLPAVPASHRRIPLSLSTGIPMDARSSPHATPSGGVCCNAGRHVPFLDE